MMNMSIAMSMGNITATASRGDSHIDMKGTASPPSAPPRPDGRLAPCPDRA